MRVLITGAARAIGAATARVLTNHGCEVVATARDPDLLTDVPAVLRLRLDVTNQESVDACVREAGDIDVVVNNAAISEAGPMERFPLDRLQACFDTNTIGALRVIQAIVPAMRAKGRGAIVNVSSVNGRVSSPLEGAYSASKFALEAISESLHFELSHFGIRVVIIEPGFIAPGMKPGSSWGLDAPYDELAQQWFGVGADTKLLGGAARPPPEVVGDAIWEAITTDTPRLRYAVGADAELVLATRTQLDDEAFEAAMRSTLGITW
jgi:NAD(P)-dependent dehydrogenase (short-subunit alcohol dehydrogenase family)